MHMTLEMGPAVNGVRAYLRTLRKGRKMSQEGLARAMGFTKRALQDWEGGQTDELKTSFLVRALEVLQGSFDDIRSLVLDNASVAEGRRVAIERLSIGDDVQHSQPLAQLLRTVLDDHEWTIQDLVDASAKLGPKFRLSLEALAQIEQGFFRWTDVDTFARLALVTDVPFEDWARATGLSVGQHTPAERKSRLDRALATKPVSPADRIAAQFEKLSPENQAWILAIVEAAPRAKNGDPQDWTATE